MIHRRHKSIILLMEELTGSEIANIGKLDGVWSHWIWLNKEHPWLGPITTHTHTHVYTHTQLHPHKHTTHTSSLWSLHPQIHTSWTATQHTHRLHTQKYTNAYMRTLSLTHIAHATTWSCTPSQLPTRTFWTPTQNTPQPHTYPHTITHTRTHTHTHSRWDACLEMLDWHTDSTPTQNSRQPHTHTHTHTHTHIFTHSHLFLSHTHSHRFLSLTRTHAGDGVINRQGVSDSAVPEELRTAMQLRQDADKQEQEAARIKRNSMTLTLFHKMYEVTYI